MVKLENKEILQKISNEFVLIDKELKLLINEYQDAEDFIPNINEEDLKLLIDIVDRNKKLLNEFKLKTKSIVGSFIVTVEKNHRKEIEKYLGTDYEEKLHHLMIDESNDPKKGIYIRYKFLFNLLSGSDRKIIDSITSYIEKKVKIYENKFDEQMTGIETLKIPAKQDYSWIKNYSKLFKFAGKKDLDIKSIGLKLKENEIQMLKVIVELWKVYEDEFINSKSSRKFNEKWDELNIIVNDTNNKNIKKNERLKFLIENIKNLYQILKKYIGDKGDEEGFFNVVGLTFNNAFAKLDMHLYTLSTLFPAYVGISKIIQDEPRKEEQNLNPQEKNRIKNKELIFTDKKTALNYFLDAIKIINS